MLLVSVDGKQFDECLDLDEGGLHAVKLADLGGLSELVLVLDSGTMSSWSWKPLCHKETGD